MPIENHVKFEKVKTAPAASTVPGRPIAPGAVGGGSKDLKNNVGGFEVNTQKLHAAMEKQGMAPSSKRDNGISKLRNNIRKCVQGANRTVITS